MSEDGRNVFPFGRLVFDIQHYITNYFVPSQDLYSLSLVSKTINSIATSALYRHVRLLPGLSYRLESRQLSGAFTKGLSLAQQTFANQILSSPAKADKVRILEWHMSSYGITPRQAFLELFPQLRYLQKLHIINTHPTDITELNLPLSPLFPHLTELTISGITYLPFVKLILLSPHRLRSITIDSPTPHSVHYELHRWLITENLENLERLVLWTSSSLDSFQIDEIMEAWVETLTAVRNSAKEVVLGFRSLHVGQKEQETRLFNNLRSVFTRMEWRNLRKLTLIGFPFPERDPYLVDSDSNLTRDIIIEIIGSVKGKPSLSFPPVPVSHGPPDFGTVFTPPNQI